MKNGHDRERVKRRRGRPRGGREDGLAREARDQPSWSAEERGFVESGKTLTALRRSA